MKSGRLVLLMAVSGFAATTTPALAGDCPAQVKAAAIKAQPTAKVEACKKEVEDGATQYAVKLSGAAGEKLEVDVSPDGRILLTEQRVALGTVPQAVLVALKAKHAGATPERAEKQTHPDGKVSYEIAFTAGKTTMEDTFNEDGTFVEEEGEDD
jgi:hypothetical protein